MFQTLRLTYKLMTACLCVMAGNPEAELSFSCQTRIKTKQRACLRVDHLDQLMRVSHSGVGVEAFDYAYSLAQFVKANRRIALSILPALTIQLLHCHSIQWNILNCL